MSKAKILWDKFDYIFILIIIFSVIFVFQQATLRKTVPPINDKLTVVVNVPLEENVLENIDISNIDRLYFDQSRETSLVTKIERTTTGINILFVGPGDADGRYIFAGRTINLNDRIKVTGGISGDGYIVKIDKSNDN